MKIGEVYLIGSCHYEVVEIAANEVVLIDAIGSPVMITIEDMQSLEKVVG